MQNTSAFLTLSFGSTFAESRQKDIGGIEQALQEAFPNYHHCRAYTSAIVRRHLAKENIIVDNPETALEKLLEAGFRHILLQPTHLLHGEEFEQKILTLKDKFAASFDSFIISTPLITIDEDYPWLRLLSLFKFRSLLPRKELSSWVTVLRAAITKLLVRPMYVCRKTLIPWICRSS